jgi:hypothetical protein
MGPVVSRLNRFWRIDPISPPATACRFSRPRIRTVPARTLFRHRWSPGEHRRSRRFSQRRLSDLLLWDSIFSFLPRFAAGEDYVWESSFFPVVGLGGGEDLDHLQCFQGLIFKSAETYETAAPWNERCHRDRHASVFR